MFSSRAEFHLSRVARRISQPKANVNPGPTTELVDFADLSRTDS